MGNRSTLVFVVVVLACGPTVGSGDGSESAGGTGVNDDGTGANEDGGSGSAADGSASTGDAADDPCVLADPASCPDGCGRSDALEVIDAACGTNSVQLCIAGGPKPGVPTTTWWTIAPSGPVFVEYGLGQCSAASQPGDGWRECSGAADEPADCACFCQQGYCRGDEHRRVLEGCGLPTPCPSLYVDPQFGASDHEAEACVLESLRDRVDGVYEIAVVSSFGTDAVRYYVFGDAVLRIALASDDVLSCPTVSDWGPASRCTLAPDEFFASCLGPPMPEQACVAAPAQWVLDCIDATPACG